MGGVTEQAPGAEVRAAESSSTTTATTAQASSSGSGAGRNSPRTRERRARSVVEDQGVYSNNCGYCQKRSRSSVAQGLWAYSLTVQDYQDLLDRGWRRSGMFLYKQCMKKTCCPPYTIRLKADSFVANKDQRRVLRRMQRYLDGNLDGFKPVGELQNEKDGTYERGKGLPTDSCLEFNPHLLNGASASNSKGVPVDIQSVGKKIVSEPPLTEEQEVLGRLKAVIEGTLISCVECGLLPHMLDLPAVFIKRVPQNMKGKLKYVEGEVDYTSSIAFAVTALLKRNSKHEVQDDENLMEQKAVISELEPQEIAEILAGKMSDPCGFTVKASKGHLNFVLPGSNISSSKLLKPGSQICQAHSDRKGGVGKKQQSQSSVQSTTKASAIVGKLEVKMKRSSFDAEEFALYKKYQVKVHNDRPEDVRESSYRRFLVDSPLIFVPPVDDGTTPSCGFGSFHQQYVLNGKLVAVGVIDILPRCLSSKYLFWDPDFAFLALGKYSVLQEIKWVQEAQSVCSTLQYYYLGFYIHSCPKMRYKAAYYPSELLCPERFRWVPYELSVPFLDKQLYVCLSDIAGGLLTTAVRSSSPGVRIEHETVATSGLVTEEDEDGAMEIEADFAQIEDEQTLDRTLEVLLEKDVPQSINDPTGPLGCIQLYLKGTYISLKHLQEFAIIPQWHLNTLYHNLNRYLQVVGPSLASRMAYTLS